MSYFSSLVMVSFWHLLLVLIIVLLVFGPSRIEGIGVSLGRAIRGFKKGLSDEEDSAANKAKKVDGVVEEDNSNKA